MDNTIQNFDTLSYLYDSLDVYDDKTLYEAMQYFFLEEGSDADECFWRINCELYARKMNTFELLA